MGGAFWYRRGNMTPTRTEVIFLKLDENARKEKLLEILRNPLLQGFLHFISLAEDIGINHGEKNWAETDLGKAFYAALRSLVADKKIRWVSDEIVQLT